MAAARSAAVSRSTSSLGAAPLGTLPMGRLRAAPTRAGWRPTAATKPALLDLTVATPTRAFSFTTVPPAALMAALAAAAEAPSAYATTYSPLALWSWPDGCAVAAVPA